MMMILIIIIIIIYYEGFVRFGVHLAMTLKFDVFLNIALCSLIHKAQN